MEPQSDRLVPVDDMSAGEHQARSDHDPRAPELSAVNQTHRGVSPQQGRGGRGGGGGGRGRVQELKASGCTSVETETAQLYSQWRVDLHPLGDISEVSQNRLDGTHQGEADPLHSFPAERSHDHPNQMSATAAAAQVVVAFGHKEPPALGAGQTPGVRQDDRVALPGQVADDARAERVGEEVGVERPEGGAARHHRGPFAEGRTFGTRDVWRTSATVLPEVSLEDGEPAEEPGLLDQLLHTVVVVIIVELPLVGLPEECVKGLAELQAVEEHQHLGFMWWWWWGDVRDGFVRVHV